MRFYTFTSSRWYIVVIVEYIYFFTRHFPLWSFLYLVLSYGFLYVPLTFFHWSHLLMCSALVWGSSAKHKPQRVGRVCGVLLIGNRSCNVCTCGFLKWFLNGRNMSLKMKMLCRSLRKFRTQCQQVFCSIFASVLSMVPS